MVPSVSRSSSDTGASDCVRARIRSRASSTESERAAVRAEDALTGMSASLGSVPPIRQDRQPPGWVRPPLEPPLESAAVAAQPRDGGLALGADALGLGAGVPAVRDVPVELLGVLPAPGAHVRLDDDVDAVVHPIETHGRSAQWRHEVDVPEP